MTSTIVSPLLRGVQIARDVLALGAVVVAGQHLIMDVLAPQYRPDLFTIHDPNKLKAVFKVMQRMGLPNAEAKSVGVYLGRANQLFGTRHGITGAALVLKPELVDSLTLTDNDTVMLGGLGSVQIKNIPPAVRQKILAEHKFFPFQLSREAIIAHEIVHYTENHSLISGLATFFGVSATALARKSPLLMLGMASTLGTASHFYHKQVELEADTIAGRKLGSATTDAMIEQFEARKQHLDQVWDRGSAAQRASLIRETIWRWLFHVSLEDRIQNLKILRNELLIS